MLPRAGKIDRYVAFVFFGEQLEIIRDLSVIDQNKGLKLPTVRTIGYGGFMKNLNIGLLRWATV